MLESLGLQLKDSQKKEIYNHYDYNTDGLLKYQEVNEIIVEILMGHIFFANAEKDRNLRALHHFNMAILIIYPSPIYDTIDDIIAECKEADENEYDTISLELFQSIVWQCNEQKKGFIEKGENEDPDAPSELEEIYEMLKEKFVNADGEVEYNRMDDQQIHEIRNEIIHFKATKLSKGLVDNDRKKLEKYLMEYFEKLDPEKSGKISEEVLFKGLQDCEKFDLILVQYLVMSQIAPKDENGLFDYKEHSFDLASYLQLLFENKNKKRMVSDGVLLTFRLNFFVYFLPFSFSLFNRFLASLCD